MNKELEQLKKDFQKGIDDVKDFVKLDELYQRFFSRKSGEMTTIMKNLKDLTGEARKEMGKLSNEIKKELEDIYGNKKSELEMAQWDAVAHTEKIDITQPVLPKREAGHLHPMTLALQDMERVARNMGFIVEDGPELESDYYVFGALNFPDDHPARESMDTFYIKDNPDWCMRAHVSNQQVRLMSKYNEGGTKPVRAAYPGRVFRNEAVDASHSHTFYQFEALVVDKKITIGDLVGVIKELLHGLFNREVPVRLRPGHFPFVEPGFEMDIQCIFCQGDGCSVCKQVGWLEMLGCGLIHPNVLREAGYDPDEWNGLAFGMGLDRLVMMKYRIEDIRHLHAGDMRFLEQF